MDKQSSKEGGSNFLDWETNLRFATQSYGKEQILARFPPDILSLLMEQKGKLISENVKDMYPISLQG